ncbi:GntR family transcriptional regulator [Chthonobacter rhizosphaerae]|uniref:GntR family transcriptional regulator n=1 Tax=Chthonobacter rhizosphaerae TaxID=2735553 RepID=UPI001FE5FF42|nr:GntR family transcriptional regulator [Chthonobacter rhizosphaerae]
MDTDALIDPDVAEETELAVAGPDDLDYSAGAPLSASSFYAMVTVRADTAQPIYQQLERQIAALIQDGTLPAGTTLPAERQLAQHLGLSRATVQRCYQALRRRRLLGANGRLGSSVQGPAKPLQTGMDRLKSFTEEMREIGREPSTRVIRHEIGAAPDIAAVFGLKPTAPFLHLVRVRFGDGIPMSFEKAWYNLTAAPGLRAADPYGSIYAQLKERCGLSLSFAEQTVKATMPDDEAAGWLQFDDMLPCLLLTRRSYTADEVMLEYAVGLFRGDLYTYKVRMRT